MQNIVRPMDILPVQKHKNNLIPEIIVSPACFLPVSD